MTQTAEAVSQNHPKTSHFVLWTLTSLFFMWGFITAMNDVLIPHLKALFDLTYTKAMLVQSCFFGAYFLISVPGGKLVSKVGYQKGIGIGLLTAAIGCVMFIPSAYFEQYWMFLLALFVLASGVTILQVAANPLVTIMGDPETASSRLTMTQAFNSLGTTVAPIIGGALLFSAHEGVETQVEASSVIAPYLSMAAVLIVMAIVMVKVALPSTKADEADLPTTADQSVLKIRHLALGVLAIFLYVGAEVSIGSFLVNYFVSNDVMGMTEGQASRYLAYYWGGAMVGRFIGAVVMQKVKPGLLLAFNCAMSCILIAISVSSSGEVAMWSILAVGLCNSIMFPTIFSLALKGLGKQTANGSGMLCLAIVGGAIIPLLQGVLADTVGLQVSFLLPLLCYIYIAFYGLVGSKPVVNQETNA
ncbi:sugar MFS transporter [Alteromonas sp. ASW11-19]|uniref:Sugar MFS transporter n=1 Tax=Alteromonas salexigens TaxID=2982530 RepID=A0ABT2VK73_9ALTE|nr:sugar MFS transporter [Alteromonas salexigens]MCU7553404.1 sugar MFS transporter [Alteromonas salexigens]